MGIITESSHSKNEQIPWDSIELVRTKSDQTVTVDGLQEGKATRPLQITVSGGGSMTLTDSCLIHRKNDSGLKDVKFIPLRSIDTFGIQTRKSSSLLVLTIIFLTASAAASGWQIFHPLFQEVFSLSFKAGQLAYLLIWAPVWLLLCTVTTFVAYLVSSQAELVIQTISGTNQIRIPLTKATQTAIEHFITGIEARVQ